jgi:hypothetical protein
MGPFLLLGVDKSASHKDIEEHWADRIKWARRSIIKVALEDINWARDVLNDEERRVKADASSLNADTTDGILKELATRYGLEGGQATRMWQPLDSEKALADYSPAVEVPDMLLVREAIHVPEIPEEMPAARMLLEQLTTSGPLDPWGIELRVGAA